jgi:hypothetical protein
VLTRSSLSSLLQLYQYYVGPSGNCIIAPNRPEQVQHQAAGRIFTWRQSLLNRQPDDFAFLLNKHSLDSICQAALVRMGHGLAGHDCVPRAALGAVL